jgi:hypothetical protein
MSEPLKFEDQYFSQLFSIESAIYEVYAENPNLLDFNVDKALNGAARTLNNQKRGRKPPTLKLKNDEQRIYDRFMELVILHTSDGGFTTEDGEEIDLPIEPITIDEMVACFKRIQRSIKLMSDQGRQGYLNFIQQFFGNK